MTMDEEITEMDAVQIMSRADLEQEVMRLCNRESMLREALEEVNATTYSHVDGRDLLAELHPRHMLDIQRRVDGIEKWFEGDWLSNLYEAMKKARKLLEPKP